MLQDGFFDPRKPLSIHPGDLPHWRQEGALYFVTFRLADSLPQSKLDLWRRLREEWRELNPTPQSDELQQFELEQRRRIERWLDRGYGSCVLAHPAAKEVVRSSVAHFNGEHYELGHFTVAPNHVHVVLRTFPQFDLTDIVTSWKRHSSGRMRKLGLTTLRRVWQREAFDHIVRNAGSLERISRYIQRHETSRRWNE